MNEILVPMLLDAGAYLTPGSSVSRNDYKYETVRRLGREIPVKGIKTPDDLKSGAVKLTTEFSSIQTNKKN